MKQVIKKQSGLTFIGLVLVLGVIALIVIFVLRLFPLYNEKFQIEAAMNTVAAQPDADTRSLADTRSAFLRSLAVTNISMITSANIKDYVDIEKPKTRGEPPMLRVHYQSTNKLFADVQLLLVFDKQIPLGNSTGTGGD
jgi:Tfp pilus assembly protein PilE